MNPAASCILLDIEGTTTSISFVYDVLFPYARRHLEEFLRQHGHEHAVQQVLAALRAQCEEDARRGLAPPRAAGERELSYVLWLMDRDSKATPLKTLQGMIWEDGYRRGRLKSQVFPDVPGAFKRWKKQSRCIAIFSSGSVLAQKLLFAHTEAGDLTGYLDGYFDTTTGAKRDPASYRAIAAELHRPPAEFLFISDVTEELAAASAAGMGTLLSLRPGNRPQPEAAPYKNIRSFDEIG